MDLEIIKQELVNKLKLMMIDHGFPNRKVINKVNGIVSDNKVQLNIPIEMVYWDEGRRPFVKKIPIIVLLNWMNDVNIKGGISVAYAIQTTIYKNGINPKNTLDKIIDSVFKLVEDDIEKIYIKQINTVIDELTTL